MTASHPVTPPRFHVMAKPTGAICNLGCSYCFFLDKEALYPGSSFRMSDEVLERYVEQLIASHRSDTVTFAWQGGEPTLLGVPFFERVVALQEKHAGGRRVENAIQTNGIVGNRDLVRVAVARDPRQAIPLHGVYLGPADAFLTVTKSYASSPRAPEALLRLGQSLAALNEKKMACGAFAEIGRKYPRVSPTVKQTVAREQKRVGC